MPANLTPEYMDAEKRYRAARTPEEKLACLEDMLTKIPKHKGTDKMQADIKKRIARTRDVVEEQSKKKKGFSRKVVKEGAGQIALVGAPNVGKSRIIACLTNANTEVADYPFTTHEPIPGMMQFEDVQVQLVDLPPVSTLHMEPWLTEIVKGADAALLVADAGSDDTLEEVEETLTRLEKAKSHLARVPDHALPSNITQTPTLMAVNKIDLPGSESNLEVLRELYGDRFLIVPCSAADGRGIEELRKRLYDILDVIRIYTKSPGKKPDEGPPYTVERGITVMEFAEVVHKDFVQNLKFARVWGSGKFEGQQVPRDHVLLDGDIVELHI